MGARENWQGDSSCPDNFQSIYQADVCMGTSFSMQILAGYFQLSLKIGMQINGKTCGKNGRMTPVY